jgi:hypothetical protein
MFSGPGTEEKKWGSGCLAGESEEETEGRVLCFWLWLPFASTFIYSLSPAANSLCCLVLGVCLQLAVAQLLWQVQRDMLTTMTETGQRIRFLTKPSATSPETEIETQNQKMLQQSHQLAILIHTTVILNLAFDLKWFWHCFSLHDTSVNGTSLILGVPVFNFFFG